MKIVRGAENQAQLRESTALRDKLINHLTQSLGTGSDKKKSKKPEPKNIVLHTIELSAEGFRPVLTSIPVTALDRTASMLAEPFFTSTEHRIPSTPDGMLMPIVQIDLREIKELNGHDLGDGLLQLWCDPDSNSSDRGTVVLIPREDVESQALMPFEYVPHQDAENSPAPEELAFDPTSDEVKVISGYESTGIHCQTLDDGYEYLPEAIWEAISDDVERFQELTNLPDELHVLGSFHPIQYRATDSGWNCLTHFPTWGSSGNAQVLYIVPEPDRMAFSFQESLR